jgi:hypothetical protein
MEIAGIQILRAEVGGNIDDIDLIAIIFSYRFRLSTKCVFLRGRKTGLVVKTVRKYAFSQNRFLNGEPHRFPILSFFNVYPRHFAKNKFAVNGVISSRPETQSKYPFPDTSHQETRLLGYGPRVKLQ